MCIFIKFEKVCLVRIKWFHVENYLLFPTDCSNIFDIMYETRNGLVGDFVVQATCTKQSSTTQGDKSISFCLPFIFLTFSVTFKNYFLLKLIASALTVYVSDN